MATKLIYFVRHGETESNAEGIRQGPNGRLTAKGREQALATAKRFPKYRGRPQVIISSPFERARETAEIIGKELGMTNAEMMSLCDTMGVGVKSHSSTLIEAQADRLRRRAERDGLTRPEQPEEPKPVKKATKKAKKSKAAANKAA